MTSKAQIKRDRKAILMVLPQDGSAIKVSQLYLQAGEALGDAIRDLASNNEITLSDSDAGRMVARVL